MAGNKMALELDSPPNILIKATLLAWMGSARRMGGPGPVRSR